MAEQVSEPRQTASHQAESRQADEPVRTWVLGAVIYAAILLMVVGIFQVFEGLAAILNDDFYLSASNNPFSLDVTAWGWVHLGNGVLVAFAGLNVYAGGLWARAIGIAVAAVSAINNFLFIPHHPFWSLIVITLSVVVIWALCVYKAPGETSGRPR